MSDKLFLDINKHLCSSSIFPLGTSNYFSPKVSLRKCKGIIFTLSYKFLFDNIYLFPLTVLLVISNSILSAYSVMWITVTMFLKLKIEKLCMLARAGDNLKSPSFKPM